MTDKVIEFLYRGIIQHLNGDKEKSEEYARKALKINKSLCKCGGNMVTCRYDKRHGKLCTECGTVWIDKKVVRKCNARRLAG